MADADSSLGPCRLVCRNKLAEKDKNEGCLAFLEETEPDDCYTVDIHDLRRKLRG